MVPRIRSGEVLLKQCQDSLEGLEGLELTAEEVSRSLALTAKERSLASTAVEDTRNLAAMRGS
jgi:hypothetical protein